MNPLTQDECRIAFEKFRDEKGKWMLSNHRLALDADYVEKAEHHAWNIVWNNRFPAHEEGGKDGDLTDAPCDKCGYNGKGYYQPETHPCAGIPTHQPSAHQSNQRLSVDERALSDGYQVVAPSMSYGIYHAAVRAYEQAKESINEGEAIQAVARILAGGEADNQVGAWLGWHPYCDRAAVIITALTPYLNITEE